MKIVRTYGIPNQVRSDKRKENVLFTNFMIANREPERASLTCGKSIHNQHIESLQKGAYNGVTGLYDELFSFVEDEEILDPFNEFDLAARYYMFLPLANDQLHDW